jgi:FkbM family methyltransferase
MNLIPIKVKVAKVLCHPAFGRAVAVVLRDRIKNRGCVINTSSETILPSVKASLFWGLYESAEIRFVQRYLRPNLDVIELGSSLGVVASHIARKLSPPRRLICVEANPRLLDLIRKNVARNAPQINVKVIHAAFAPAQEEQACIDFAISARNLDSRINAGDLAEDCIQVPVVTLEKILTEESLEEYTLVADIEGAEIGLINGGESALSRCRQLIIELHRTWHKGEQVTVEVMLKTLQGRHGFSLRDRYGPVCVLEK